MLKKAVLDCSKSVQKESNGGFIKCKVRSVLHDSTVFLLLTKIYHYFWYAWPCSTQSSVVEDFAMKLLTLKVVKKVKFQHRARRFLLTKSLHYE